MRLSSLALLVLALPLAAGCAVTGKMNADPQSPYPPPRPPAVGDILHLPTGIFVSEAQMLAAATDARIVFVGETHDNPASHRLELTLLRALADRYPGKTALGMEMFTAGQQSVLDDWVAGAIDEKTLLKTTGFDQHWGWDYYREILRFARERRTPIVGLNAERSLVREVGRNDWSALSEEQRRQLPAEIDLDDPYQQAMTRAVFADHEQGGGRVEGFLRVQTLWDETMAENVVRYLRENSGTHMLVMAGGNHIRFGFGIPRRVFRRLPESYVLVGTQEVNIPEEKRKQLMDISPPAFPMPPYDFLVYADYEVLPDKPVRLGVMLQQAEGRVLIQGVLPESPAAEADLRKGDVIIAVDGEPVAESFDVIFAVKQKKPGDRVSLGIERDAQSLEVEVILREFSDLSHGHPKKP